MLESIKKSFKNLRNQKYSLPLHRNSEMKCTKGLIR